MNRRDHERVAKGTPMVSKSKMPTQNRLQIVVHCNGSGARRDGLGSGYGWLRLVTGESHIKSVNGLTNNAAECWAILSALRRMPRRSSVCICTSSQLACQHLNGIYSEKNTSLASIHRKIRAVLRERRLTVSFKWIRKNENCADKLLRQAKRLKA
jgi:ribonuclease HI